MGAKALGACAHALTTDDLPLYSRVVRSVLALTLGLALGLAAGDTRAWPDLGARPGADTGSVAKTEDPPRGPPSSPADRRGGRHGERRGAASRPIPAAAAAPAAASEDDWSWDPFGPVGNTDGFTAIALDPTDPRVFWIAGSSSVWVTDDAGDTFTVVLHMSRSAGSGRASNPLEDDEDVNRDFDGLEPGDYDAESGESEYGAVDDFDPDEGMTEGESVDEEGLASEPEDTEGDLDTVNSDESPEDLSEDRQAAFARASFGVSRLRVAGDHVWVCTSRGLWRLPRGARTLGEATELRLGRRFGVNDVLALADDRLLIASDAGLWLHERGLGRRVRGLEYDAVVTGLAQAGGRVFAASSLGLYGGDAESELFTRLSAGGRGGDGLLDVVVRTGTDDGAQVFTADGNRVIEWDLSGQATGAVWPVPGASRLAVAPDGAVWTVGPRGPWRWDGEAGWERFDETLSDRRLRDLAVGPGPATSATDASPAVATVRVVGVVGAWRLITGREVLTPAQRLERTIDRAIARSPDVMTLLAKADAGRTLTLEAIDAFTVRERLAWLLPLVEVRLMSTLQRDERRTLFPAVGQRLLDMVEVVPQGDFFQVMAWWDLMPAVLSSLNASRARTYENARIIARRNQRRVRETIPPLWRDWAARQRALWQGEPATTREAVRAILAVAQLEAQLHAVSQGRFPMKDNLRAYLHPDEEPTP